jgi:hypothetical protein
MSQETKPTTETVETFSVVLPVKVNDVFVQPDVSALEAQIAGILSNCLRLIRWAIVAVTDDAYPVVEGAYLKKL